MCSSYFETLPSKKFFPTSRLTQERKKNWVPTSYLQEEDEIRHQVFFVLRVAQIKKAKDFFADELHPRASTGKPRKPLSPPGLVYRHKKGTWESQEKEKKRKWPRKARRGLQRRQGSVCPTPRIPFLGSQVFGLRSGPSWLKYRLLQDLVYKEAMCKVISGNGLLYAVKAVPQKYYFMHLFSKSSTLKGLLYAGWRSRCKVSVARKVRTIAWAKREQESCHLADDNQPLFTSWKFLWWFHTWAILRSLANARKCQLKDFLWERKVWIMSSPTDVHRRRFPQKAEKGKVNGSDATTRFPWASCFWEAHVQCTSAKKLVSSNFAKILKVATKIRDTCEKTLFTPSSPVKDTKLYRFCLSNKRSPKSPINV